MPINKGSFRRQDPSNQWFKNVAKSLGYTSTELITSLAPSTVDMVRTNGSYLSDSISELRQLRSGGSGRIVDALNIKGQVDIAQEAVRNAREDLRSGKLYNKARKDKAIEDDMGGFSLDGDDDFGLVDINIDENEDEGTVVRDSEGSPSVVIPRVNVNVVPPEMTANNPMVKSLVRQTTTMATVAKAQMQQNQTIASVQMGVNFKYQTTVTDALGSVNSNLALLVQFQNDSMGKYIGASLKYYEESLASMNTSMKHLQMMMPVKEEKKGPRENPMDNVVGGGFNLQNYFGEVKNNVKNQFETNPILSAVKMMFDDKNTLRDLAQSPLSFISTKIVTTILPKFFQETMGALDRSIENFFPAIMAKMSSWRESDNPMMRLMGDLFGVRNIKKTRPDLGKYERGQIPFDGETKVAITEVIPGYLRKILAELSGGEDMAFDYKQRRFRKATEMKADYDREVTRRSTSSYGDSQENILKNSRAYQFKDQREREKFDKGVTEFFEAMTKKGSFVNPELRRGKNGELVDDIKETYSFNDAALDKLLRQSIMAMSKGQRVKLFGNEFLGATNELRQMMEQLEANPSDMNAQILFDGLGLGKDIKNKKDKPKIGRSAINGDQYGKTSTDYLRDIKSVLLQGIKVLPMAGFNGGKMHRNARGEYNETMAKHKLSLAAMEKEEDQKKAEAKDKPAKQKSYSEKELRRMYRQGQVTADSVDLLDITDRDMQDQIQSYLRNTEEKDKEAKKGFMHGAVRYLKGDKQDRANMMRETIDNLMKSPAKMFQSVMTRIDDTMYSIVFGRNGDGNKSSFFSRVLTNIDSNFKRMGDWMNTKVFDPMKDFFVGENGIINRIKGSDKYQEFKGYAKKAVKVAFGEKDINGVRRDGLLGDYGNELMDHKSAFTHVITGKAYTDRNGQKFEKNPDSVFGEIGKVFRSFKGNIKDYLVGDKNAKDEDNKRGILTGVGTAIGDGFNTFREALFGPKEMKGGKFESRSFKEMTKVMRQRAPKTMAWGTLGIGAGALMGGTGLLGSLILPGGPLGAAMLGSALGFATQSESFNSFMFGEKDFDGNRMGGIIGQGTQKFFKKNKAAMIGGATVGVLKPMLGLGLIPSFLLPGGPIGGALFGVGTAMLYRSEIVQKTLFGEKDFDGKRAGGILQKAFGKKVKGKSVLGNLAVGMAGGAGLAGAIGQFGLIGAMLTPGGLIGGALIGAAAGIALSSDRWKKSLFGEWNIETGTREGGLLGKTINRYKVNVEEPLKQAAKEMSFGVRKWFTKKVSNPLEDAIAPLKQMFKNTAKDAHRFVFDGYKNIKKTVGGVGSLIGNTVNRFLENDAINPMVTYVRHYITGPLTRSLGRVTSAIVDGMIAIPGKLTRGLLTGMGKMIGGIATLPIKALSAFTNGALDISHRTRGVKAMRRSERAALREQKDAGYKIGWNKTTDQDGNEVGDGRWGSLKRRYLDGEYIRQAQYNKEGAGYQLKENERKKERDAAQDEKFANREEELKAGKEKVKALKKFGRRHQYENISKDGVDISRFYKVTKNRRRFGKLMENDTSRDVVERSIEGQLGVTAQEIFGENYDPSKITKKQRQLLQTAVKKKHKGEKFDIRKHFGLKEKVEPSVTTGLDSVASEMGKVGTEINTMATSLAETIKSTSTREDVQSKLVPNAERQTTFLEQISSNMANLVTLMSGTAPAMPAPAVHTVEQAPIARAVPLPQPEHTPQPVHTVEMPHHDPKPAPSRQTPIKATRMMAGLVTGYNDTAMAQLTHIIKSAMEPFMDGRSGGSGSNRPSDNQPDYNHASASEAAPASNGGPTASGSGHQGTGQPRHSSGSASNPMRQFSARGAWNRVRNFRRNGGVSGLLGRTAGAVQSGLATLGNVGRAIKTKVTDARTAGFLNLLKGGISSIGQSMKNNFNGQRTAVMGGRQSYLDPRHAGGTDMYQNPTEGGGMNAPSAASGISTSLATNGGMFAPISSLSMNESVRGGYDPGKLDSRLEARQAFNRRRTGDYEIEQLRIKEERASVASFRESMMSHANNIDLTTYEILEILRNWPHCCQGNGLPIPPVIVPPVGGGKGKKPPKEKNPKPKGEPRPPKLPPKPYPEPVPKTVVDPVPKPVVDPVPDIDPKPVTDPTPEYNPRPVRDPGGVGDTAPSPTPRIPELDWGWDGGRDTGTATDPAGDTSTSPGRGWSAPGVPSGGWAGRSIPRFGKRAARFGRRVANGVKSGAGKAWQFGKGVFKTGQLGVGNIARGIGGALKSGGRKVGDLLNRGKGGLVTGIKNLRDGALKVGSRIGKGTLSYAKNVGRNLRFVLSGGANAQMGFINNPLPKVKIPDIVKRFVRGNPEGIAEDKAARKERWDERVKKVKDITKKVKTTTGNVFRTTIGTAKDIAAGAEQGFIKTVKGTGAVLKDTFKGGMKSGLRKTASAASKGLEWGEDMLTRGARSAGGRLVNGMNTGFDKLVGGINKGTSSVRDMIKGTGVKGGRGGAVKGALRKVGGVALKWAAPLMGAFSGAESLKNAEDTFGTKKLTTAQKIVAGATGFLHGASPIGMAKAALGKGSKIVGSKDDFTREIYSLKDPKKWWKDYGKKGLKNVWNETDLSFGDYKAPEWWQKLSKNNKTVGKVNDWMSDNVGKPIGNFYSGAKDKAKDLFLNHTLAGKVGQKAVGWGKDAFNKAKEWYPGVKSGLKTAGEGFGIIGDHVGDLATKAGKGVKNFFNNPLKSVGGFFFGKKVGAEEKDVFPKKDKNGKVIPGKFVDAQGKDVNPMAAKKGSMASALSALGGEEDKGFMGNAKDKAKDIWDKLTKSMTDGWKTISDTVTKPLKDMKDNASKTWGSIADYVSKKWEDTKEAVSTPVKKLWDGTKTKWKEVSDYVSEKWDETKDAISKPVKKLWDGTKTKWKEVSDYVSGKWDETKDAISTPVKKLWDNTKKVWKDASTYVSGKWKETKEAISAPVKEVWSNTKKVWESAKDYIIKKWDETKESFTSSIKSVWSKTKKVWTEAKDYVADKWDDTKDYLTSKVKSVYDKTKKIWEDARKYVAEKWDDTKDYLTSKVKSVYDKTKKVWEDTRKYVAGKWDDTKDYLTSKVKAVYDKTKKVWEDTRKYVATKWDDTKDYLTSKVKSVYEKTKKIWEDARKYVADKWDDTKDYLTTKVKAIYDKTSKVWEDTRKYVADKWDATKTAVVTPVKAIWTKTTSIWDSTSKYVSTKWDDTKTYVTDKIDAIKKATTALMDKVLGLFTGAKDKAVEVKDKMAKNIGKTATKMYDGIVGVFTSAIGSVKDFGTKIAKKTQSAFEKLFGGGILSDSERKKRYGGGGANYSSVSVAEQEPLGYGGGDAASDPTATPFFSQKDPKWANMGYGDHKVKDLGCAPTSAAMVVNKLTGTNVTPQDMAQRAMGSGYVDANLGTHKDFFRSVGMQETGAKSKEVMGQLMQNKPVVLRGEGGGPFTKNGHFVVATGLTKDGKVKVNDPLKNAPTTVTSRDLFSNATTGFVAPMATKNNGVKRADTAKGFGSGVKATLPPLHIPNSDMPKGHKTGYEVPRELPITQGFGGGKAPKGSQDAKMQEHVSRRVDQRGFGAGMSAPIVAQHYGAGYRPGKGGLKGNIVTSEYRSNNMTPPKNYHTGIDLTDPKGNKTRAIHAFTNGTVVSAGPAGLWGNMVVIVDEHGYKHYYAHLSRVTAKAGQKLKKGSMIGNQGSTGRSTGSHLHYQVCRPGTSHGQPVSDIDPEDYATKYSPDKSFIGTLVDGAKQVWETASDMLGKVKDSAMGIFDFVMGAEDLKPLKLIGDLGVSLSQSIIKGLTPGWIGDAQNSQGGTTGGNVDTSGYVPGNLKNTPVGKLATAQVDKFVDVDPSAVDAWINSRARSDSAMRGLGKDFVTAAKNNNLDPRMLVALAAQESGWGTSNIAKSKGNLFGWKAYDSSPYASSQKFKGASGSVHYVADRLRNFYINQKHLDTLAEMNTQYSTSKDWAINIATIMQNAPKTKSHGGGVAGLSMLPLGIGGGTMKDLPPELSMLPLGIGGGTAEDLPKEISMVPEHFGRGKGSCTACKKSKRPNMFGGGRAPQVKQTSSISRPTQTSAPRQSTTIRTPAPSFSTTVSRDTSSVIPVPTEGLMHVAVDLMSEMVATLHVIADNTGNTVSRLDSLNAIKDRATQAVSNVTKKPSGSPAPYNANPVTQAAQQPSKRSQHDRKVASRIASGRM